ncbi:unnamed protein product [Darwinula stevensoni]|uniref:Nuclear pore complex protein Nup85 n=1 Tax=Darwinula stevensoni TaxID=69355 RepID=A0A7R9A7P7_9CRUS|nr:unnamed protein product [Darwinula stevensoni]CAG0892899.1 unnamed protein product [Darwinula stevensoni]
MAVNVAGLKRNLKNIAHNYTDAQVKVREATSNDPWGPSSTLMSEVADMTHNVVAFSEIMQMIWKRLNDHGKNWRHVYKALVLLEYLIKTGSDKVAQQCKENIFAIQTLKDFQHVEENKDLGMNVREKSKQLVALLTDEEKFKSERARALKAKERFSQSIVALGSESNVPIRSESYLGENTVINRTSRRISSDLESARPQTAGEEELQLQLALAMSKEEADQEEHKKKSDDVRLQLALSQSEEEFKTKRQTKSAGMSILDLDLDLGNPRPTASASDPWAVHSPPSMYHSQTSPVDPWGFPMANEPATAPPPVHSDPWGGPQPPKRMGTPSSPVPNDPWMPTTTGTVSPKPENGMQDFLGDANSSAESMQRRKKPEDFLGENSNLVNLDNLIGQKPPGAIGGNPFAMTAVGQANPFQSVTPPRPSLNQMKTQAHQSFHQDATAGSWAPVGMPPPLIASVGAEMSDDAKWSLEINSLALNVQYTTVEALSNLYPWLRKVVKGSLKEIMSVSYGPRSSLAFAPKKEGAVLEIGMPPSLSQESMQYLVHRSLAIFERLHKVTPSSAPRDVILSHCQDALAQYREALEHCLSILEEEEEGMRGEMEISLRLILSNCDFMLHLTQVLFFQGKPGDPVSMHYLTWIQKHCHGAIQLDQEVLSSDSPSSHPSYWKAVQSFLMQGRIDKARQLLRLHWNAKSAPFKVMDELLDGLLDFLDTIYLSPVEFTLRWKKWQEALSLRLKEGVFSTVSNLESIAQVMSGDVEVLEELAPTFDSWYEAVGAYLLWVQPSGRYDAFLEALADTLHFLGINPTTSKRLSSLDRVLLAIMQMDFPEAYRTCRATLDNSWLVVHLCDILLRADLSSQSPSELRQTSQMREYLLTEYVWELHACMYPEDVLVRYLDHCPSLGKELQRAYLNAVPLTNDIRAMQIMSLAHSRGLTTVEMEIARVMAAQCLTNGEYSNALRWAALTKNKSFTNCVVDHCLSKCRKYQEFHRLMNEQQFDQATRLLISLVRSRLAPRSFCVALLHDACLLLEREGATLSLSDSAHLLDFLEELDMRGEEKAKIPMEKMQTLRKTIASNVLHSIVSGETPTLSTSSTSVLPS